MSTHPCISCGAEFDSFHPGIGHTENSSIIERQLTIIYFVKKLLNVPAKICSRFLISYGNPEEWIHICADCSEIAAEGRKVYQEMQILKMRHNDAREKVRMKMKIKREVDYCEINCRGCASQEILQHLDLLDKLEKSEGEESLFNFENLDAYWNFQKVDEISNEVEVVIEPDIRIERPRRKRRVRKSINKTDEDNEIEKGDRNNENNGIKNEVSFEDLFGMDLSNDIDYGGDSDSDASFEEPQPNRSRKSRTVRNSCSATVSDTSGNPPKSKAPRRPRKTKTLKAEEKKREKLTFAQVLELHQKKKAELTSKNHCKNMTTLEYRVHSEKLRKVSVSFLVQAYRVDSFPCSTCSEVFKRYKDWLTHTKLKKCGISDQDQIPLPLIADRVKCEKCGKLVSHRNNLEDHIRTAHSPPETLICRGCSIEFRKSQEYQRHYHYHAKSNPSSDCVKMGVPCPRPECPKVYRNSEFALGIHLQIRHDNPPPPTYSCLQCNVAFPLPQSLRAHLMSAVAHNPEKNVKCSREDCPRVFNTIHKMRQHVIMVHESRDPGAERYACEHCNKEFNTKQGRNRHVKLHNSDSPHLCTICGKRFKLANYLTIHMWSHDPKKKERYAVYKNNANARALAKAQKRETNTLASEAPQTQES